jgi:protein MAK16
MKTIERTHLPNKWWERIRLPSNYAKALELIDERLIYWPKFLVHKCKQRLTRLTQVAIRTKKLIKEQERLGEKLVPRLAPKVRRREESREQKAHMAAKVERSIERELLQRLRSGAYGAQPINVEEKIWQRVLKNLETTGEGEIEEDPDELEAEEEYEEEIEAGDVEYVSDVDFNSEDGDIGDLEDWMGSDSNEEAGDGDDAEGDEDDEDEETDKLKQAIANLKRKRPSNPTKNVKPKKKTDKSPKREIEYQREVEVPKEVVTR